MKRKPRVVTEETRQKLREMWTRPEYRAKRAAIKPKIGPDNHRWKGGVWKSGKVAYDTYINKLPGNIQTRRDPDNHFILQIVCKQCGEWFSPNIKVIQRKLNGKRSWNCFCSKDCYGKYYRGRKRSVKPIKHVVIIKTVLYKQLLAQRREIAKLKYQKAKAEAVKKNKKALSQRKKWARKKKVRKTLLLKKFRLAHPNRYKKYKHNNASMWFEIKRWQDPSDWRITRMVTLARRRAKQKGWSVEIDKEWCRERIDRCEATGIPFDNTYEGTFISMNPYAPSIDRIDNSKEYTKDNCRIVLTAFNSLKHTLSDDELYKNLKQFVNYYEQNN